MKAFVLGQPIEHSLSPVLHSAAYEVLGADISYGRREVGRRGLPEVFAGLVAGGDLAGLSVTMPLKFAIIAELDRLTDFAQTVGVVNTVFWRQGLAWGHNTDVSGIVNALLFAGARLSPGRAPAILGGGGTATAAVAALVALGASSVDVFVRDAVRAGGVAEVASRLGIEVNYLPLESFPGVAARYEAVISTLPSGAADSLAGNLASGLRGAVLLDVSYDPWPSLLATAFEKAGGAVVSGKEMLMYQAFDQVKLFTGGEVTDRGERDLEVLNAMCASIGLPQRDVLPQALVHIAGAKSL